MKRLATGAIDVSDPDNPIFPHGHKTVDIDKYVVAMLYHPDDFSPGEINLDTLLYGSPHVKRVSKKAAQLKDFVNDLRRYISQGQYVIVRGWKPAFSTAWDEAAIQAFKGTLKQSVDYHGAHDKCLRNNPLTSRFQTPRNEPSPMQNTSTDSAPSVNSSARAMNLRQLALICSTRLTPTASFLHSYRKCFQCSRSHAANLFRRPIDSSSEALKITKNINSALVPLCADQATRLKATALIPDPRSDHYKERHDILSDRIKARADQATKANQQRCKEAKREWDIRVKAEIQRLTAAGPSPHTQSSLHERAVAGLDQALEVPPVDNREWCDRCMLMSVFNQREDALVRRAEQSALTATSQSLRFYNTNPLSEDNQHLPMDTDTFNQSTSTQQHLYQNNERNNRRIQTHSIDALFSTRWDVFTHTGFHTYAHHDASGMSTWIHIRSGCKVWAPLIPVAPVTQGFMKYDDLFDVFQKIFTPATPEEQQTNSHSLAMFLLPHDLLQVFMSYKSRALADAYLGSNRPVPFIRCSPLRTPSLVEDISSPTKTCISSRYPGATIDILRTSLPTLIIRLPCVRCVGWL